MKGPQGQDMTRPLVSGFCACGIRLPLGPWPHAKCPRCLAVDRIAADPLGATHAAPEYPLRADLLGAALALAAIASLAALLFAIGG